jgi:hypothetical protein
VPHKDIHSTLSSYFSMNSDFMSSSSSCNSLPSSIDTLDDAIAYLQKARETMGGKVKFRLSCADYITDSDEYHQVGDVVLTGTKSLMNRNSFRSENGEYVLFVYE